MGFNRAEGAPHAPLQRPPKSLRSFIAGFKASVTSRARRELNSSNIWQRNYYEHILRDQTDYERIAGYILANPSKWNDDEENPMIEIK
jgi:REP element-mobilizing transposase RayT